MTCHDSLLEVNNVYYRQIRKTAYSVHGGVEDGVFCKEQNHSTENGGNSY